MTCPHALLRRVARHADWAATAGLALAALIFYWPLVFAGHVLVDYDALVYFGPQRAFLGQSLRAGHLPLWDPSLFMGAPFLANPQTAVLYPPSWLYALTSANTGYTLQLVLHAFLASVFTYHFARRALDARPLAATVGALAYSYGGFTVGQSGHLNQISAAAWLPAILLAYDQAVARRSLRWAAAGALAFGLQLLAGHPQESYMSGIALVLFGLVRAPWRNLAQLIWAGVAGALVVGFGVGLAAAQLLPLLELTPLGIRGAGVRWLDAVAGSLPSYLQPQALLPPFWLPVASGEYLGYVGVAAVTLGFLALLFSRSRLVLYGFLLCLLGIFLAAGQYNGYYGLLFGIVPGFETFRVPARWLFLWDMGAVVLAVLGAEWLLRGARVQLRRPDLWPRMLLVAFILAAGVAWQMGYGGAFPGHRVPALWATLALATLACGALATWRYPKLAGGLLVALTAVELYAAADASPIRQAPPGALLGQPSPTATFLLSNPATRDGRVLGVAHAEYVSAQEPAERAQLTGVPNDALVSLLIALKWRDTLTPNEPLRYGLPAVDGYDGGTLPLQRFVDLSTLLIPADQVRPDGVLNSRLAGPPDPRLLDLLGVQDVVANPQQSPTLGAASTQVGDVRVDVQPDAVPLTLFIGQASVATDETDALSRLADASFDPNTSLVLESSPSVTLNAASGRISNLDHPDPEHWRFQVSSNGPGYVLQREAWYPGWVARVDGLPVSLVRADVLFRAIPIASAGTHEVELSYEPGSFRAGAIVSLVSLLLVLGGFVGPVVWRRRAMIRDVARAHS